MALERHPGFWDHTVDETTQDKMAFLRTHVRDLAELIEETLPDNRDRSLALTALEEAGMRAIQCLATQYGSKVED